MNHEQPANKPERALPDDMLALLVRGVFAFTIAVGAADDQRREQHLRRQDPRLN